MIPQRLVRYLLISYAICWSGAALIYFSGLPYGEFTSSLIVAFICMPAPAIASWFMMKFVLKRPLSELGVNWRTANKQLLLLTPVWLLIWVLAYYGIVFLGDSMGAVNLMGTVDFSYEGLLDRIEDLGQGQIDPKSLDIPPVFAVFSLVILGGIIAGSTINLVFTLGEEIGWRGFMYNELISFSLHKRVLITGVFWGFWHAPLILMGHNYPGYPYSGILMMILFCVVLSYPMDWLRRNTNSVLGPGAFHGMINGSASGMMLFVAGGHTLVGSIVGLSGILSIAIVYGAQKVIFRTT